MSDGFLAACPGDVLSTKVVIADDKVSLTFLLLNSSLICTLQSCGRFRHENRPKLPAPIEPSLDDPNQARYDGFADDSSAPWLPLREPDAHAVCLFENSNFVP
jgi:hypothetical protein